MRRGRAGYIGEYIQVSAVWPAGCCCLSGRLSKEYCAEKKLLENSEKESKNSEKTACKSIEYVISFYSSLMRYVLIQYQMGE